MLIALMAIACSPTSVVSNKILDFGKFQLMVMKIWSIQPTCLI